MRKWFHLLALAVYIPGIIVDPPLLSLAAAVTTVAFFVIEVESNPHIACITNERSQKAFELSNS